MAITKYPPNTVWLGGPRTEVGDLSAGEVITPGMLVERYNNAGVIRFRKHSGAGLAGSIFATEQSMLNKGVDDTYAVGDLMEVTVGAPGTTFWGLIASGANIAAGDKLASAGNGLLGAVGGGIAVAIAIESKNNTAGPANARIRVECV